MAKRRTLKGYNPTPIQRIGAPEKFQYELKMFKLALCAHLKLSDHFPDLKNATLESLLVHARNLYDFFCGPTTHRDDMRAFHFTKGKDKWRSTKMEYLKSKKKEINKYLAHLTYTRVIERKPKWDWNKINKEIEAAYQEFLDALPDEEKDRWRS